MSLERAYKACELCHGYNNVVVVNSRESTIMADPEGAPERVFRYNLLKDNATIEALKALEDAQRDSLELSVKKETALVDTDYPMAGKALRAGANCDYSKPSIVEVVKEEKISCD